MQFELDSLKAENERFRCALRFYAKGEHHNLDGDDDFDTVSGEPENWLFSCREDSTTMIEDGTIASRTLRGETLAPTTCSRTGVDASSELNCCA